MLVRLSPLIWLVDDFGFYYYHTPNYDSGFDYIAKLCSNWTRGKWVPPFTNPLADQLTKVNIDGQTIKIPNKFQQFGWENNFWKNVSNSMALSLPFSVVIFLLLMGLVTVAEALCCS
jgi:hypothetical protein